MKTVKKLMFLILALSEFQLSASNRGIYNQNGNDCFMNASTQALSHISELRESYANIKNLKEFQQCIPLKTFFDYINKLSLTSDEIQALDTENTNPTALVGSNAFRAYWTNPNNYMETKNTVLENFKFGQHDAQEFISAILDILDFYFNKLIQETKNGQIKNPINSVKFNLITRTTRNCGHSSLKIDPASMLKIDISEIKIPEGHIYPDLIDCFNKFSERERMSGDNQLECEICPKINGKTAKTDGTKCLKLFTLPKILMISFCRFTFVGMEDKVATEITFPIKLSINKDSSILDEDITKMIQEKQISYHLFAIVCHGGGTGGGHYWAYGKDSYGNWYKYNDSDVTKINQSELINIINQTNEKGTPYILFYELDDTSKAELEKLGLLGPKSPLQLQLSQFKSSLQELKIKLQTLQDKLTALKEKLKHQ